MKRILSLLLVALLLLSIGPVSAPQVSAANEDLSAILERQLKDYAKSIDQKDAATTAATALLTNAAFRGKDLSFDSGSATAAMIFNSAIFQEAMVKALVSVTSTMHRLNSPAMVCSGGVWFYSESAGYLFENYEGTEKNLAYRVNRATYSETIYPDASVLTKKYNENDVMLSLMSGSMDVACSLRRDSIGESTITYRLDFLIHDQFEFDGKYTGDYDRDLEELLNVFGKLTLQEFDWKCTASFTIEVPYHCNHNGGSYRWIRDPATGHLVSDTTQGLTTNAVTTYTVNKTVNGETTQSYYYGLEDPVVLSHTAPWVVEYDLKGSGSLMLSSVASYFNIYPCIFQYDRYYTWIQYYEKWAMTSEEIEENKHSTDINYIRHSYGPYLPYNYNYSSAHVYHYRLENRIAEDGSNMVYLTIYDRDLDQQVYGPEPLDDHRSQPRSAEKLTLISQEDNWVSGKDIVINFIGNSTYPASKNLSDLRIYENGEDGTSQSTFLDHKVNPTCTAEGCTLHTCTKCGYSYKSDATAKLPHDYAAQVIAPTCTAEGYTVHTCTVCGDRYQTDATEKLPHNCTEFRSNNDATCAHDGTKTGKCTVCGEKVTVADEGTMLPHTWTDATCEAAKTCRYCGATEGEALGHDLKHYNAKAPTCESVGWDAYEKCLRCSHSTFARIAALGHEYVNGVCTRCGHRDGTIVPGEVNGDGRLDILDAYQIILYLSGKLELDEIQLAAADMNCDAAVDIMDVYQILLHYTERTELSPA